MDDAKIIYLDNAATTRMDQEVVEAMRPYFSETFANPATLYQIGQKAAKEVDKARDRLAALLNCSPEEVYFTSGGTESDNWLIKSAAWHGNKKHLITSAIEHHAVLESVHYLVENFGCRSTILNVDKHGLASPDALRKAISKDTALVSVMHANNEIGTVEPICELAAICRENGVPFHTDAVQSIGKIPVDVKALGVDSLSLSAHKFHGPKGIGALYVRKGVAIQSFIHGGGQEQGLRAGTSNVPGIVGLGAAAELAQKHLEKHGNREWELVEYLWNKLSASIPKLTRNGHPELRIPNILNISVFGIEGEAILLGLDQHGIQISSGSACTTGNLEASHVLTALKLSPAEARGAVRFSLGRKTTKAEIDRVIEIMPGIAERFRAMSPLWKN